MMRKRVMGWQFFCAIPFVLCLFACAFCFSAASSAELLIDRASRTLSVIGAGGTAEKCRVGTGKGGLGVKTSMQDQITPTGVFVVDLVLFKKDPRFDEVKPELLQRYEGDPRLKYLQDKRGLAQLFDNMNSIDFNNDGKADTAYGIAYIGLEGIEIPDKKGNSRKPITGIKLSRYGKTVYWWSIALHGTPKEDENIGKESSGGCVHVPAAELQKLIESKTVQVGTKVTIR